jgi:hypothetical protein
MIRWTINHPVAGRAVIKTRNIEPRIVEKTALATGWKPLHWLEIDDDGSNDVLTGRDSLLLTLRSLIDMHALTAGSPAPSPPVFHVVDHPKAGT